MFYNEKNKQDRKQTNRMTKTSSMVWDMRNLVSIKQGLRSLNSLLPFPFCWLRRMSSTNGMKYSYHLVQGLKTVAILAKCACFCLSTLFCQKQMQVMNYFHFVCSFVGHCYYSLFISFTKKAEEHNEKRTFKGQKRILRVVGRW